MAKKTPPSDKAPGLPEPIEDAVILSGPQDSTPVAEDVTPAPETTVPDDIAQSDAGIAAPDPVITLQEPDVEPAAVAETEFEAAHESEPAPETEARTDIPPDRMTSSDTPTPPQVVIRKGGFVPLLLGGVAAAVIGFAAARTEFGANLFPKTGAEAQALTEMATRLSAQSDRIGAAEAELAGLRDAVAAPSGDAAALADLQTALEGLTATLSEIDTRIAALEQRPVSSGADPRPEIAAMRDALAAQAAEIAALGAAASQQEQAAMQSAQAAMARAALSLVQASLDSGSAFGPAVADLADAGVTVPSALSTLVEGAPTLASLQAEFPELARAALAAARSGTPDAGNNLGGFLRGQLGIRSLEPRAGDDPDAILSRAEAALREGRLSDATAEIAALPEAARVPLAAWSARAAQRQAAVDAAETLRQSLTAN